MIHNLDYIDVDFEKLLSFPCLIKKQQKLIKAIGLTTGAFS